ncbi:uncharacterized protein LOC127839696 [Dreissena polymorpha]|uniref:uncharacterized protein LOC127839696 n=1 Tax=Dreissena polymorpha TaxID=45954 RepID=UPI0022640CBD|nr:uncharacterized protein LOC127839696 [Dreissena polymorpha]
MWKAAQLIVFVLVFGQGHSAIDDVFRQVKEEYDDWCRYRMKGSNRTLVKLHYDMVIDEKTYKDALRKEYYFKPEDVTCEIHGVGQAANRRITIASNSKENHWPLEIPYQIDEGFGTAGIRTIIKALEHWSRYTCLHFVERTFQYDRIIFTPVENICESYVGRMIGPQYISLDPQKCMTLPIILHEIGHSIGLYHEHTKADRDDYIIVHYENINRTYHYNFDKLIVDEYLDFNQTYDYHSIMHYGKNFFADPRNETSLEPKDGDYLDIIGEAQHLSFHDVQIVNAMYKCKEKCAHVECPKGAFVGKNCECFCQGLPEDPVQRCNNARMFCAAPDIDLSTYRVSNKKTKMDELSGTRHPNGTVLTVLDLRCSERGTGNYTCQDGQWVAKVNCTQDRCVYDRTRYVFKPNIPAAEVGRTTEYVNSGTLVHVECRASKGTQGYDSECRDSRWVPALQNCDAVVCDAPDIDLFTHSVYQINNKTKIDDLSGTRHPDGTVLTVVDLRCSEHGTGNYTCRDGQWVTNANCKPDRCVYDRNRYVFKPNNPADGVGLTTEYVDSGRLVHVECPENNEVRSFDSTCQDSRWVPALPDCDKSKLLQPCLSNENHFIKQSIHKDLQGEETRHNADLRKRA